MLVMGWPQERTSVFEDRGELCFSDNTRGHAENQIDEFRLKKIQFPIRAVLALIRLLPSRKAWFWQR